MKQKVFACDEREHTSTYTFVVGLVETRVGWISDTVLFSTCTVLRGRKNRLQYVQYSNTEIRGSLSILVGGIFVASGSKTMNELRNTVKGQQRRMRCSVYMQRKAIGRSDSDDAKEGVLFSSCAITEKLT